MDSFERAVLLTNAIRDADPRLVERTYTNPAELYAKPINIVSPDVLVAVSDLREMARIVDARLYRLDAAKANLNDLIYCSPMRDEIDFARQSDHTPFVTFEGYLGSLDDKRFSFLNMLLGKRGLLFVITPTVVELPAGWVRCDMAAKALQKAA